MDAGFLRGNPLGLLQGVQSLADLAAHGVRLGQVEIMSGLPFRRQAAGINLLC